MPCCVRCGPATPSRTPSAGCCRPSGSACWPRGTRCHRERELAARLGVSRDTVREAIKSLADAGYLVSRRGRYGGTFLADELPATESVVRVNRAEIDDALRLREILEVGAARMAATPHADRRRTRGPVVAAGRRPQRRPADDYRRLDSRLHLAIAEAAGSPSLVPLVAENRMRLNALLDQIPLLRRNIAHSDEQHEAIVIAILAGDADAAAAGDACPRCGIVGSCCTASWTERESGRHAYVYAMCIISVCRGPISISMTSSSPR